MDLEDNETNLYEDGYPIESDQEGDEERLTEYDGDSEAEEGVLFIRSTISQDDTKDMASKERSMLVQLTERLNSGEFLLQGAGLGPLRNSMPPYPGMPAHISQQLSQPDGPPHTWFQPSPRFQHPYPFQSSMGQQRPRYKTDKNAKWRQRLLDKRHVASNSVARDDPGQQGGELASKSQNTLKVGKINSTHNLETQPRSIPTKDIGKPIPEMPQTLEGEENTNSGGHVENHRVRLLESDKVCSQVKEGVQTTTSEEQGAISPSTSSEKETEDETPRTDLAAKSSNLPDLGLAESLSYITQRHLGVDLLDQSVEAARFSGYLLDTIELLERRLSYLQAPDDEGASSSDDDLGEEEGQVQRSQILHRIFCYETWHNHSVTIFEDQPTLTNDRQAGTKILTGEIPITNLSNYLTQRPSICFVVFKEHKCPSGGQLQHQGKRLASQRLERLRIISPILAKALEKVAEFSPWYQSMNPLQPHLMEEGDDVAREMDAPYDFLFHHRKQLAALEKEYTNYSTILTPLREFLEQNYEKEYEAAEALLQADRVTPLHLGKLFKPNQMVIVQTGNPPSLQAYVLTASPSKEKEQISFKGWSWEYNGVEHRRKSWRGTMGLLPDEQTVITELPIHPAEFATENALSRIEARGKEFWNLKDRQFSTYNGYDWNQEQFYAGARFMVDMSTYHKMHRYDMTYRPSPHDSEEPVKFDNWPVNLNRHEILSTQLMMLLPPMIYGFNIEQKRWVSLDVEKVKPMKWNKKAFDRLVLNSKTKELIYALVDVQTSKNKKMDDIIAGKGNGLIILLHGSPGTGKTLTAESVAEIAEKPLYRVTCGDIGTEAQEVEKYLQTVLYLGKIWDCVLLMDEADVFLEERSMADLQRNSLVSVFLRILEYYEGILILTSNRVGTFDEAFKSRIQVAIHYDKLTKGSRKQIWQNFFDMIEESNEDVNISELEGRLDELAAEEMNGRQIRNALLTARQLAKHRKERLDWEHLSQVMTTSAAFNKYLKSVKGHTDEQWAREERIR